MDLTSSAFASEEAIPAKYTCDGADVSPPLKISDVPGETESLALVMDDPDAPGGTFDHWLIWDLPPGTEQLPESIPREEKVEDLAAARQGLNDFGQPGYRGPCPPAGVHRYRFKLFALSASPELASGSRKPELMEAIKGKIITQAELVGKYSR